MDKPSPHLRRNVIVRREVSRGGGSPQPAAEPSPPPRGTPVAPRALIVEMDAETRRLCQDVLEDQGFVVDVVENGVAAVSAARLRQPDVIMVDLQLRDVSGLEVIRWLRSNPALKSTPMIALSANAEDTPHVDGWSANALLTKPVSAAAIARTIRKLFK